MSATRYDSPLRYNVDSASTPGVKHLVEIDAFNGNGRCACPHFVYRLEKLCTPSMKPSNATRCHHILEARDELLDEVIRAIKAQQKANGHARQESQI